MRFCSIDDNYDSNKSCMLEELFKNNKFEYIHINKFLEG